MKKLLFSIIFLYVSLSLAASFPWSVVYKKIYSFSERTQNQAEQEALFRKKDVMPFTQLIFSWNGFLPEKGKFVFFVRVHIANKSDDDWEPWHKAILWSQDEQRSFFNKEPFDIYNHVRLEIKDGSMADGFEIKALSDDKKAMQSLYAFFVCVSNYTQFKPELPYKAIKDLSSVYIPEVNKKSQKLIDHPRINALCSPTTVSMFLEFLLGKKIDSLETARNVYDAGLDVFGSWPFNCAYAFEKSEGRYFFYTARLSSFAQLHNFLCQGVPVAVSIRGPIKGGRTDYKNGHFILVVGFDSVHKKVICYDPAFEVLEKVEIAYPVEDFLIAWEKSYRMAYLVHSV